MENMKPVILIVDDVPDNIRMLIEILKEDFATIPATSGEAALEKLANTDIDLVLLDILMPGMDGYETCQAIRSNLKTVDIPVIFITALSEVMDNARGFDAGAVDYISKPFNPTTVRARIKNQVKLRQVMAENKKLYKLALDSNPISGLPGNNTIRNTIDTFLKDNVEAVVVYADLDNFKAYNDQYGFAHGDEVLLFASTVLKNVMEKFPEECSFLGHIGGDDFVMLIPPEVVDQAVDDIISSFDEGIRTFYNSEDLERGHITATDRLGTIQKYPIICISMAGVQLVPGKFSHYLSVVDTCTEIKKLVKKTVGSFFIIDQRL